MTGLNPRTASVVAFALGSALALAVRRRPRRYTFAGRTVLITGGSRGLGLALARRFATQGARLVLVSRTRSQLERARDEIAALGADVHVFEADLRSRERIGVLMPQILAVVSQIDVLVNNAGVIQSGPLALATTEDFEESLAIHFWAPLHLTRAVLPYMPRHGGRIVNISSIGGRIAVPHLIPYCVGKFALAALSDGLRAELAKDGISVLTVTPGLMRTGSYRNVTVRGDHRAEAQWFALASATPLTAMDVDRAAATIVGASRRGQARLTFGVQARAAQVLDALAPDLSAAVLEAVAAWLPGPAGGGAHAARSSRDLDLGWVASVLPSRTAARMNQKVATDEA